MKGYQVALAVAAAVLAMILAAAAAVRLHAPSYASAETPPPPAAAAQQRDWKVDMLRMINAERKKAGAPPLCLNAKLNASAQAHTADQARRRTMSHTGGDGSDVGDRVGRAGYRWTSVGENVAQGYRNVAQVMAGWMSSPGHRANLLQRGYKHVGLGRLAGSGGPWWTQVFGSGSRETCAPTAPAAAPKINVAGG